MWLQTLHSSVCKSWTVLFAGDLCCELLVQTCGHFVVHREAEHHSIMINIICFFFKLAFSRSICFLVHEDRHVNCKLNKAMFKDLDLSLTGPWVQWFTPVSPDSAGKFVRYIPCYHQHPVEYQRSVFQGILHHLGPARILRTHEKNDSVSALFKHFGF